MVKDDKLILEDAKLIFRNFSGQPSQFNPEGKRTFCVVLESEMANRMKEEGWNIRWSKPRDEAEDPKPYMEVTVAFNNYPPTVQLITSKNKTLLHEPDIGMLDWVEIKAVHLIVRPYSWEVNGNKGIKAYLKSMYVEIEEDVFTERYSNLPTASEATTTKTDAPTETTVEVLSGG